MSRSVLVYPCIAVRWHGAGQQLSRVTLKKCVTPGDALTSETLVDKAVALAELLVLDEQGLLPRLLGLILGDLLGHSACSPRAGLLAQDRELATGALLRRRQLELVHGRLLLRTGT
eukprot:scaffold282792_cov38-Prasinocladus_malaysianus.AAC.1